MSEKQRTRRKFLADLLFLGGAAGAVAFLAQAQGQSDPPQPAQTPQPVQTRAPVEECKKVPEQPPGPPPGSMPAPPPEQGNFVQPQTKDPATLGDVEYAPAPAPAPEPQVRGRMKMPNPAERKP